MPAAASAWTLPDADTPADSQDSRGREVAHKPGQGRATAATDGTATRAIRERQRAIALGMSLRGHSLRQIAARLGCHHDTARERLREAEAEAHADAQRTGEQWRATISARLDSQRVRLERIARGEPEPLREPARRGKPGRIRRDPADPSGETPLYGPAPTVAERLQAERLLAAIEEQRAKLQGANAPREDGSGELADWLHGLVAARKAAEGLNADVARTLPPPTQSSAGMTVDVVADPPQVEGSSSPRAPRPGHGVPEQAPGSRGEE